MWGSNPDARLMMERSENVLEPSLTLMSQLKFEDSNMFSVETISLGVTHSAVITNSGELFTAGSKIDCQLGGDNNDREDGEQPESNE